MSDANPFLKMRVLVADDNPMICRLIMTVLNKMGMQTVTVVTDGDEAWKKIQIAQSQSQSFDLIISDIAMPGLTGLDLLSKVRTDAHMKATPFILLTGHGDKAFVVKALQLKVTSYLVKPYVPQVLETKITEALFPTPAKTTVTK